MSQADINMKEEIINLLNLIVEQVEEPLAGNTILEILNDFIIKTEIGEKAKNIKEALHIINENSVNIEE